jgi:hypothetical protein
MSGARLGRTAKRIPGGRPDERHHCLLVERERIEDVYHDSRGFHDLGQALAVATLTPVLDDAGMAS